MAILQNLEQTVTLLIILSILVVAHEWGHFIVARLCGIRVDDFSIGFGKRLFRIGKRGDTEYNVRMLPLGGFVKIAGMEPDEAPLVAAKDRLTAKADGDPDARDIPLLAENTAPDRTYTAPDGFYSKPLWQRSLVILAGPVMSFVFGYVVFCLMGLTTGIPTGKVLTRISQVEPGGEGQRIGLHAGDVITAINGTPVADGKEMIARINGSLDKPLTLTVRRGGETFTKAATPRVAMKNDKPVIYTDVVRPGAFGQAAGLLPGDTLRGIDKDPVQDTAQALADLRGKAGKAVTLIVSRPSSDDLVTLHGTVPADPNALPALTSHQIGILKIDPSAELQHLGLVNSIKAGNLVMGVLFQHLGDMVRRPRQIKDNAGGIIYMYQATGVAAKNGLADKISLMASLSVSLAVFNLLPIPVLDGGHLLTFFIEWVRRGKRLTDEQQMRFQIMGLAIIAVLFLAIMSNDILRTIKHQLPQ